MTTTPDLHMTTTPDPVTTATIPHGLPTSVSAPVSITTNDDDMIRMVTYSDLQVRNQGFLKGERIVGVVPVLKVMEEPVGDGTGGLDQYGARDRAMRRVLVADSAFVLARSGLAASLANSTSEAERIAGHHVRRSEELLDANAALEKRCAKNDERILSDEKKIRELSAQVSAGQDKVRAQESGMQPVRSRLKALELQLGAQRIKELEADGIIQKLAP
jgi:hypothetical protein